MFCSAPLQVTQCFATIRNYFTLRFHGIYAKNESDSRITEYEKLSCTPIVITLRWLGILTMNRTRWRIEFISFSVEFISPIFHLTLSRFARLLLGHNKSEEKNNETAHSSTAISPRAQRSTDAFASCLICSVMVPVARCTTTLCPPSPNLQI